MKKNISILLVGILMISMALLVATLIFNVQSTLVPPTSYPVRSLFSKVADEAFVSSVANHLDLGSGITLERSEPLYSDQINNITFAVFNHTEEPIVFPDQAFGLTIFRYNDNNMLWEKLHLQYVPSPESKTVPPKVEKWDFELNNSWTILDNETLAWGYQKIRLYVSGKGKVTNKSYGAYLDVTISVSP